MSGWIRVHVDDALARDAPRREVGDGLGGALQRVVCQRRIAEPALRVQREHCIGHRAAALGMASREAAQSTPTTWQLFSSGRLNGSFGISPLANPITR